MLAVLTDYERWTIGLAIVTAAVTATYATFAVLQWLAIRATNRISARALDAIDGPILVLRCLTLTSPARPNNASEALYRLIIENRGRDSAINLRARTAVVFLPLSQDPSPILFANPATVSNQSDAVLSPGEETYFDYRIPIAETLRMRFVNGELVPTFGGEIFYDDRVLRTHRIAFIRQAGDPNGPDKWAAPCRDVREIVDKDPAGRQVGPSRRWWRAG